MSLIDSKYVEGQGRGIRGRHGAHYFQKNCNGRNVPCMTIYNNDIREDDKVCPNCFRTSFDPEATRCPRCGSRM